MASIEKRKNKDGSFSYQVNIRRKGYDIYKTFMNENDAKLYAYYKDNLITNMENFDVPINQRINLIQIVEMKKNTVDKSQKRAFSEFDCLIEKLKKIMDVSKMINNLTLEDWKDIAKKFFSLPVFKGAIKEHTKKDMSPQTFRRYFAVLSSCFSHAISQGIDIENFPLKIINIYSDEIKKHKNK